MQDEEVLGCKQDAAHAVFDCLRKRCDVLQSWTTEKVLAVRQDEAIQTLQSTQSNARARNEQNLKKSKRSSAASRM